MKKQFLALICSSVMMTSLMTSCKKDKDEPTPTTATTTVQQSDQSGNAAADGGLDDVNDFINNGRGGGSGHRVAAYNLPCGVVRIDSSGTPKTYSLVYGSATPCGYKKKSGTIAFSLAKGTDFNQAGAVIKITYTDYKVEILATNDVVTVNGTFYITNVDGGYVWEAVISSKTIKHKVRGTFEIKYANGDVRSRNYFQLRTWTSNNSWAGLSFSVAGDTSITVNSNTYSSVSETGKTYEKNYDFVTNISTPYKWSNCGSTFAGPYVLKEGNAKMNITSLPLLNAYFDVEAGYYYNTSDLTKTPTKVNDCTTNAYKIYIQVGTATSTQYQLY